MMADNPELMDQSIPFATQIQGDLEEKYKIFGLLNSLEKQWDFKAQELTLQKAKLTPRKEVKQKAEAPSQVWKICTGRCYIV